MAKAIYFDMDGTLADFYAIENWLRYLENESAFPYSACVPLINRRGEFARLIRGLQSRGYVVGIISWGSRDASAEYMKAIRKAKREWLKIYFPAVEWDEIHIVRYGTSKQNVAKVKGGILFDDNKAVRDEWNAAKNSGEAYSEKEIMEKLGLL